MSNREATLLDIVEQMEALDKHQKADVLLLLTTHTAEQIMRIAEKTLSPKSWRKFKAAVDKERGH